MAASRRTSVLCEAGHSAGFEKYLREGPPETGKKPKGYFDVQPSSNARVIDMSRMGSSAFSIPGILVNQEVEVERLLASERMAVAKEIAQQVRQKMTKKLK